MSTYPYIAKDRFLEISLDIERQRQALAGTGKR